MPGSVFPAPPGDVSIAVAASDPDGAVSRVDFYRGGALLGTDTTAPYGFTASGLAQGAHLFTAIATDNLNATTAIPPIGVTITASPPPLPWLDADVGAVAALGSASFASPTFTVRGSGTDIAGAVDAFHYTYQPVSGNVTIVARVATIQSGTAAARVGIMIRESLAANSRHAAMLLTPPQGVAFHRRPSPGAATALTAGPAAPAPQWIKLVRAASTLTGYVSPDGVAWTLVGSGTVSLPSNALVGLAVTSRANGTVNTSTLDDVAVTSP